MIRRPHRSGRAVATFAVLAAALTISSAEGAVDPEKTLIDLLVSSDLVVRAKIHRVESAPFEQIRSAVLEIRETVKGEATEKNLPVAEEKLFPSDTFLLQKGREALLFLRPVPGISRWADHRSRGLRFVLIRAGPPVATMGQEEVRQAAGFLEAYMLRSAPRDEAGRRALFEFLLASLNSRVEAVQEAAASAFPELAGADFTIRQKDWESIRRFINNREQSLAARVRMVEKVSRTRLFETIAPEVIRNHPDLRLAVLDAVRSSRGAVDVPQEALLVSLQDPDPKVRQETLQVLSLSRSPGYAPIIGETSLNDPDPQTRAKAMAILAGRNPEESWDVLSRGLEDENPHVVYLAAGAIRDVADDRSAPELSRLLDSESPRARFIGVLMLGTLKDDSARRILEVSSKSHEDAATRELCTRILETDVLSDQDVRRFLGTEDVDLISPADQ